MARTKLNRNERGSVVEAAALAYLVQQGLQPLAQNARARSGEIDLVMHDGEGIVFIEVRYRASQAFGGGAASVDFFKRRKLVRAAQVFLLRNPKYANVPCRFDVIAAEGDPAAPHIEWIRDAFRADEC